jgi:hypothetical protein
MITNDELRKQTNEIKITEQITRRKWNWIGHAVCKENAIEKEAMEWNPQGQRKRERPKRSRQITIQEEALAAGNNRAEPSLFQSAWNQKNTNFRIRNFKCLIYFWACLLRAGVEASDDSGWVIKTKHYS